MHQPDDSWTPRNTRLGFLDQISPEYLESLEYQYEENPSSLSADWQFFFEAFKLGQGSQIYEQVDADSAIIDELRVLELISVYRKTGHLTATTDPLGLKKPPLGLKLELKDFQLDNIDPERVFQAATELGLPPSTLPKIWEHLKATYCSNVAVEFQYIRNPEIYGWIKTRIDLHQNTTPFPREQKLEILKDLALANQFENFLQNNYMGQKRFSIEGGEALIPALKRAIHLSSELGAEELIIGMAHRGRLNVLVNIMQKPFEELFKEFEGAELPENEETTGDVKYHQGFSSDMKCHSGRNLHLSLAPNPSHLEFVDPVVEGMARAKLEDRYGDDTKKIVPLLIHGDAAVIGQGVVPETLNLSQLKGYATGGTVHIVINNQIGFTTVPEDARSSYYCTDWGKAIQCPIFHVNGDDPEAVVHAIEIAVEYRMKFKKDVFVDIVCYRKYGHNEGDEPRFTQPKMYETIGKHDNPFHIYRSKCIATGVCDEPTAQQFAMEFDKVLAERRERIRNGKRVIAFDAFRGQWEGLGIGAEKEMISLTPTPISKEHYETILAKLHSWPSHLKLLPKFQKMLETRLQKIKSDDEIDWAVGESLGFSSLLLEGTPVRVSGQDAIRGTFSHRHAAYTDIETVERYYPMKHLDANQARLSIFDSPLSEAGVLGFDYGYSLSSPKTLVCWEAQFGDFVNGAQVIIDQFISSAEAKWLRMSGITLLLPHGYEGQGPEHSSARLERFLQLCSQMNMQVAAPTTPAQICHLLRRQMHRKFRKPLIVMTPKSLLRHPQAVSKSVDFLKGGFQNIIVDEIKSPERVVLCSGKVYYDLKKAAAEKQVDSKILFVRVEQLYPLDAETIKSLHQKYAKLPWIWCQEEPRNMGAWAHMRLKTLDWGIELQYAGRAPAASPATGSHLRHTQELLKFLSEALGL